MKRPPILFWRRFCQIAIVALFVAVPLLNLREIHVLSGGFLSFEFFGITVADPAAMLQVFIGALGGTLVMLWAMLLTLALALICGPVFCGWICPYGLLSECAHSLAPKPYKGLKNRRVSFLPRLGILALGLILVALFLPYPVLNQLSMPGWFTKALQHAVMYRYFVLGAAIIPVALLVEVIVGRRLWCSYFCPQSVLISLVGWVNPVRLRVNFTRKKCTCPASDRACQKECSLNLDPRDPDGWQRLTCINCGDCIDACRKRGQALSFTCKPK